MSMDNVGLVLSGGGAKGAYQVGVVRALDELGVRVDKIAGASIGALNGAVLACSPDLAEGSRRLEQLWRTLAQSSPLQVNGKAVPYYLVLLAGFGLEVRGLVALRTLLGKLERVINLEFIPDFLKTSWEQMDKLSQGLMDDSPLREQLARFFSSESLMKGLPLYVSLYPSEGALPDFLASAGAALGIKDTVESEFLLLQSLESESEQHEALLASAAIPLLFSPRRVNGSLYSDGGQGGWSRVQGNTPIQPLLDAGCKTIIVTHLSDGSLWSRQRFRDTNILEIRPESDISKAGFGVDMLGFDESKLIAWAEQGYKDTKRCLGRIIDAQKSRIALAESEKSVDMALDKLCDSQLHMERAIERLKARNGRSQVIDTKNLKS